jgi:hypothetical protein
MPSEPRRSSSLSRQHQTSLILGYPPPPKMLLYGIRVNLKDVGDALSSDPVRTVTNIWQLPSLALW